MLVPPAMPMLADDEHLLSVEQERRAQGDQDSLGGLDRVRQAVGPSSRIVNSSPPRRAIVSLGAQAARRRWPTCTSSWSPAAWPRLSLTTLKRSRSMNSTASSWPQVFAAGQGVGDAVEEQRPIGQPGERIVEGAVAQLLFEDFALGRAPQRTGGVLDQLVGPRLHRGARTIRARRLRAPGTRSARRRRRRPRRPGPGHWSDLVQSRSSPRPLARVQQLPVARRWVQVRVGILVEHGYRTVGPPAPETRRFGAKHARSVGRASIAARRRRSRRQPGRGPGRSAPVGSGPRLRRVRAARPASKAAAALPPGCSCLELDAVERCAVEREAPPAATRRAVEVRIGATLVSVGCCRGPSARRASVGTFRPCPACAAVRASDRTSSRRAPHTPPIAQAATVSDARPRRRPDSSRPSAWIGPRANAR